MSRNVIENGLEVVELVQSGAVATEFPAWAYNLPWLVRL